MPRPTISEYTARDINILHDLYQYRTLTAKQINIIHFGNREKLDYAYTRLHQLKKENLIEARPLLTELGRKSASCYFLTDKGIAFLIETGRIEPTNARAKDIRIEGRHLPAIVEVNQFYAELTPQWTFQDSREVKRKYHMNRANLIQGSLQNEEGNEFGLYLIQSNPEEETLLKLIKEILNERLKHYFIFCKGREGYIAIKNKVREFEKDLILDHLGILPYNKATEILKNCPNDWDCFSLFNQYGSVHPVQSKYAFTRYTIQHEGEEKFVANYLLGDHMMVYFLRRYNYERYQAEKKKVLLFVWNGQVLDMEEEFHAYPHIEIFPIIIEK
jgi:hypothetical protein